MEGDIKMPNYVTQNARNELASLLGISLPDTIGNSERIIEGSINGEKCIIVCFAIVVRTQPSEQRYIDLHSCGRSAWEKILEAWNKSISDNKKFFFFAINHLDAVLQNYIFSLELSPCDFGNNTIYITREYENDMKNGDSMDVEDSTDTGGDMDSGDDRNTGIEKLKRYKLPNRKGYLSIIKKNVILDYVRYFDNRPYMINITELSENPLKVEIPKFIEKITEKQTSTLKFSRNRLLTGAPGTGKSHRFSHDSEEFVGDDKKTALYTANEVTELMNDVASENIKVYLKPVLDNAKLFSEIRRITFYPDYSYGNFVGCYKPTANEQDEVKYEFIEGPFIELLAKAVMNPYENYCLIIEEINRAKAASVFGDIFQLLDRDSTGKSEYSIKTPTDLRDKLRALLNDGKFYGDKWEDFKEKYVENMYIPHNLYIWATMNMADQGVFPMDSAFKRRWEFEFMPIDGDNDLNKKYLTYVVNMPVKTGQAWDHFILWDNLRKEINKILQGCGLEEDRLIGPYFMKPTEIKELENNGNRSSYPVITKESLVNKLFSYLKQDILRFISADKIFKNNNDLTSTMSAIRNAVLTKGFSLQELFVFSDSALDTIDSMYFNVADDGDSNDNSTRVAVGSNTDQ